ncbi:hypothetical protein [Streptomyces sp. NPDC047014]|uniref:hypothetical protein n=1 Tax=Streptomyces sp. NPDC047014 TaxID=3155736 RepID=UPI0033C9FDEE
MTWIAREGGPAPGHADLLALARAATPPEPAGGGVEVRALACELCGPEGGGFDAAAAFALTENGTAAHRISVALQCPEDGALLLYIANAHVVPHPCVCHDTVAADRRARGSA